MTAVLAASTSPGSVVVGEVGELGVDGAFELGQRVPGLAWR